MRQYSVWVLLGLALFTAHINDVHVNAQSAPSEYECRPYIEKAIHELKTQDTSAEVIDEEVSIENDVTPIEETTAENLSPEVTVDESVVESVEAVTEEETSILEESTEIEPELPAEEEEDASVEEQDDDEEDTSAEEEVEVAEDAEASEEEAVETEEALESAEVPVVETVEEEPASVEESVEEPVAESVEETDNESAEEVPVAESAEEVPVAESAEEVPVAESAEEVPAAESAEEVPVADSTEVPAAESAEEVPVAESAEEIPVSESAEEVPAAESAEEVPVADSAEVPVAESAEEVPVADSAEEVPVAESTEEAPVAEIAEDVPVVDSTEEVPVAESAEEVPAAESAEEVLVAEGIIEESAEAITESVEEIVEVPVEVPESFEQVEAVPEESTEESAPAESVEETVPVAEESTEEVAAAAVEESVEEVQAEEPVSEEEVPAATANDNTPVEEDLLLEFEIPKNLRDKSHIYELLGIESEPTEKEIALNKIADVILKDLKKIYDQAIKPLESLYKYRDLSNRHFGDPEIFSKPLILFMGPWSGGKSTILNYLTHNEHTKNSVRTGAEPSPAYFNIMMHGDTHEVLDGTQLAADWTFSGLQKFGQGLLDRLKGHRLPNKLLEKVNIVEIPGILEVRKQVSKYFPFNDACQWFIDHADIIFLVYDPSKLDVGPETEAILDQLKGREYQTRILLNKADQVKAEELLRVQSALIWNISPLMSSASPPVMYTVSLWSHPFEDGAPVRLLQSQERQLLQDMGNSIEKRIENKIASARRFAVRVRNHAKMVDCYLTTYYNQKTLFGNKKTTAEKIIENPQQYHIYEGLSTLKNISRYDLPDPEVYRDFFTLNPLYNFQRLSETCTYFRGCPINKLDVAIAYDLPELVGKYKKMADVALEKINASKAEKAS